MSGGRREQPPIEQYFLLNVRDELLTLLTLLRHRWYLVLAVVLAVGWLVRVHDPLAPRSLRVASGQQNSTLEAIAEQYAALLARHGVRVEIVPSKGAIDSLAMLESGKVDVALSQGGAAEGRDGRAVYLASIGYQPLWFFHRGPAIRGEELWRFMREHRVSIGQPGSGTRRIYDAVLSSGSPNLGKGLRIVETGAADSVRALLDGRIDGMFLLAGAESGNAQALLAREDLQVLDFPFAAALAAQHSYLETVTLHRGTLGLAPMRPPDDLRMVATTTSLLTTERLHPALVQLLLRASVEIGRQQYGPFQRAGGFPAMVDKSLPYSDVARRYLTQGPPTFEGRLPFWASSLLDRTWFGLLAIVAIAYPLLRLLPRYRMLMFDVLLSYRYGDIFDLYRAAEQATTRDEIARLRGSIEALRHRIESIWVPKGCFETFGRLLTAMHALISRVDAVEARIREP